MRIVALAVDRSAGAAYRALLPMQALAERGHETSFLDWDMRAAPPPLEALRRADVVHMWRLYRGPARQLAGALKEAGVAVVFDNDDDMTRVPKNSPAYREMRAARAQVVQELGAALRQADLVTTTCGELAGRLRRLGGGDVRVVENYVEPGFVRARGAGGDGVTIGWVAGQEHRGDLKDLRLRRVFQELLDARPEVRLVSIGVDVGVRSDRYVHREFVPFPELPDHIAQFDLGIAPLADVSFNRVRSNVKLKEYAAAGVPWLASPIGPYKGLGEEQGGRLVADFRWAEQLAELVGDAGARGRLAERAAAWGRTQTVHRNAEEWEAAFAAAAERAGRSVGLSIGRRNGGPSADAGPVVTSPPAALAPASDASPAAPVPEAGASPAAPVPPADAASGVPGAAPPRRRGLFRRRARD